MNEIKMVFSDIFESDADVILHQVNCRGVMGSGIAKQVRDRYPEVFAEYRKMCSEKGSECLGHTLFSDTDSGRVMANLFAQDSFGHDDRRYTDYDALSACLSEVAGYLKLPENSAKKVAVPYKMGCGLGGGNWQAVSALIHEHLVGYNVKIYVYTGK